LGVFYAFFGFSQVILQHQIILIVCGLLHPI